MKSMRLLVTTALIALFTIHFNTAYAQQDVLKIGVYQRPFFMEMNEQGQWQGMDLELAKAIFDEAEVEYEILQFPWKRVLHLIKLGKVDVALSAAPLEYRKDFAHFSQYPFRHGHNALYIDVKHQNLFEQVNKLKDLRGLPIRLATVRSVSYSDEFELLVNKDWFKAINIVLDHPSRLIEMVKKQRVHAYLDSEFEGTAKLIASNMQDTIKLHSYLMSDEEALTYLMFSKKSVSTQQLQTIDDAMARLYVRGEYQAILNSYKFGNKQH